MTVAPLKGYPSVKPGRPGDPGLFGPGSAVWKLNGEMVLALGGGRALLLQLAHPSVAAGVSDHSGFKADPFERLWRTLDAVLSISFGDTEQAAVAAERVTARHRTVKGMTAAGDPYDALDPELLLWVHATLVDSALLSYELFVGDLEREDRERYYEEMKTQARILEVPEAVLPATLADFENYFSRMTSSLEVTSVARMLARDVLWPRAPLYFRPAGALLRSVTVATLPARIRDEYELRLTPGRERAFAISSRVLRRLVPLLPKRLRRWPHARGAAQRIKGRPLEDSR